MAVAQITAAFGNGLRIFVSGLGISAIIWGAYTLPIVWQQSGVALIASHILEGDRYKAKVLTSLIKDFDLLKIGKWSRPSAVVNSAVLHVRILENAMVDGDQDATDLQMIKLHNVIDGSLANAPADSFLWVVLFWLENTENGYSPKHVKYLRMSYSLGPNEGWIAVKRNRVALASFPQLPPDLAQDAKAEFVRLVDSRMDDAAADILVGPGWGIRTTLLAGLKDVSEFNRQLFARTVYNLGYDVSVPGVRPPDRRPWQ